MSEFQEAHTVSTLKGSPPGYVGYGEGGILTEAVRRRPYSVVLLDEVEKAHPDVHEIFFQVFDKGWMEDGEGRDIDFKNTIILLTTNVGTDLIMSMCKDPELMPEPEGIAKALREPLLKMFPAALLGRLVVIPYYPLSDAMLANIIRLQLGRIAEARARPPQDSVHLRRRGGEADRQPLHRGGERRAHDRRDPDQHRAAGDQPRVPDADDGRDGAERRAAGRRRAAISITSSTDRIMDAEPAAPHVAKSAWTRPWRSPSVFQQHGQLAEAAGVYRQILALVPDHPDALHYSGVLAHQQGRSDEGVALIRAQPRARAPDRADCYSNLGIIFKAQGRVDDAVERLSAGARARAGALPTRTTISACCCKAQGRLDEAEAAYRDGHPPESRVRRRLPQPRHPARQSRPASSEAVECYCKVITLSPQHPEARRLLALAHCTLGESRQGRRDLRGVAARRARQRRSRGTCWRRARVGTCRRGPRTRFVETVFDDFAASFDAKLAKLSYRAPQLVAAMLADAGFGADGEPSTCSTPGAAPGCAGRWCAPYARRLTGVDLSGRMLDRRPREKQVYDELVKGELTGYLRQHPGAFDVIVSADTLVYFGALDEVFAAAAAALRPGGLLIFTRGRRSRRGDRAADYRIWPRTAATAMRGPTSSGCWRGAGLQRADRARRAAYGGGRAGGGTGRARATRGRPREPRCDAAGRRAARGPVMPRAMEIATPLGDDVLLFHGMHAREEMGRLCEYQLDLLSPKGDIALDDILGKNVTVKLALPERQRHGTSTATSRASRRAACTAATTGISRSCGRGSGS